MIPLPQLRYIATTLDEDGIFVLKYNRPEVGNAISNQLNRELLQALEWAVASSAVKVIVQTGEGKFFTTGMDMSSPQPETLYANSNPQILYKLNKLFIDCPKITIAAVNGPAVGYGTSSLGLFDLVYSVPDAYFFTPFIKWGLCAEACSSFTFAQTMGRQRASHLIFTGQRMSAKELEVAGLVSKVLPRETFLRDVLEIARSVARLPGESVWVNKNLIMGAWREELHRANEKEFRSFVELLRTEDARGAAEGFAREQALKRKKESSL
ncbi:ClpP/crotonase-like domain-containing protein [Aspergillus karnatakaensis]|uniref:enoyl-CoA hydratase/isomerase family protein n=1 Tax=Aspergillus karnatakaensis TaxID=1810916 RepID=UPI003CCD407C